MIPSKQLGNKADLRIIDCGQAAYQPILAQQQALQEQRKANSISDTVLLVEHTPVVTLGARVSDNRLLSSETHLKNQGIDLVSVRRGGGGTAHNPGQLVFYPILNLQVRSWGISTYISVLETIGVALLASLGVTAHPTDIQRGLWVGERKIASIGVRISRSVTFHGMAINIQNDLSIFDHLIPCGLTNVEMTSAQRETGKIVDMAIVKQELIQLLKTHLCPPKVIQEP